MALRQWAVHSTVSRMGSTCYAPYSPLHTLPVGISSNGCSTPASRGRSQRPRGHRCAASYGWRSDRPVSGQAAHSCPGPAAPDWAVKLFRAPRGTVALYPSSTKGPQDCVTVLQILQKQSYCNPMSRLSPSSTSGGVSNPHHPTRLRIAAKC